MTAKLLSDGVDAFITPFEKLLAGVESAREATVLSRPKSVESSIPDDLESKLAARVEQAQNEQVARRIWHHDQTLWGGPGPEIGNRLGWLTISQRMLDQSGGLNEFVDGVRADGMQSVVLCGMGGSSLAPEVMRQSFERGVPKSKVEERGATKLTGTKTTFSPDPAIFPEIKFKYDAIARYLPILSLPAAYVWNTSSPRARPRNIT